MSGVKLHYDGIAVGSNDSFELSAYLTPTAPFSSAKEVTKRDATYENYGFPTEPYSVLLDGSVSAMPRISMTGQNIGFWSNEKTDEEGNFSNELTLIAEAEELFTSAGLTFFFDVEKNIFPTEMTITWLQDLVVRARETYYPDRAVFVCQNKVEHFNRVQIKISSLNMPNKRLWLQKILFGLEVEFTSQTLKNAKITQAFNPSSSTLPIGTFDFTITSKDIEFVFERKQSVEVFFDDEKKGHFYIKKGTQKGRDTYSVNCEDVVSFLEDTIYNGNIYNETKAAYVIRDICTRAGVPVKIDAFFENQYVITGHIPRTTCREALQQVVFVLDATAMVENDYIAIKKSARLQQPTHISQNRIMSGVTITEDERFTELLVTEHSYFLKAEEEVLYNAKESGSGERIELTFSEPKGNYRLLNGDFIEWSANHVIFSANENSVLYGKSYVHDTKIHSRHNEFALKSDKNVSLTVDNVTLVNSKNIDSVMTRCYNYYKKNRKISAKVVEGKKEDGEGGFIYDQKISMGDNVALDIDYGENVSGVVEKQAFHLKGGILVKEITLR